MGWSPRYLMLAQARGQRLPASSPDQWLQDSISRLSAGDVAQALQAGAHPARDSLHRALDAAERQGDCRLEGHRLGAVLRSLLAHGAYREERDSRTALSVADRLMSWGTPDAVRWTLFHLRAQVLGLHHRQRPPLHHLVRAGRPEAVALYPTDHPTWEWREGPGVGKCLRERWAERLAQIQAQSLSDSSQEPSAVNRSRRR